MSVIASLTEASQEVEKSGAEEASYDARALRELASQLESTLKSGAEDKQFEALRHELLGKNAGPDPDSAAQTGLQAIQNLSQAGRELVASVGLSSESEEADTDSFSDDAGSDILPVRTPERLEVLAGSVTAMQASIAELRDQFDKTGRQQQPSEDAGLDRSAWDAHFQDIRTDLLKSSEVHIENMSAGLNERIKQNERRNVSAIKELGTQLARANARMEERQKQILSGIDTRLNTAAEAQQQNFDQALSGIHGRLEAAGNESRQSLEPLRNTMASLARRVDALERPVSGGAAAQPGVAGSPGVAAQPGVAGSPGVAAQPGNPQTQARTVHPQAQTMAMNPQGMTMPDLQNAAQNSQRYAVPPKPQTPGAGGEDCLRSVRDKLKAQKETEEPLESSLVYERRSGLPIVAASALALAVAGGGALSSMRGKEDMIGPVAEVPSTSAAEKTFAEPERRVVVEKTVSEDLPQLAQAEAAASARKPAPVKTGAPKPAPRPQYASLEQAVQAGLPRALYEQGLKELAASQKLQGTVKIQRAAESGLAVAQYRMSKLYERGEGVPRSISRARAWAELAAKGGNVRAMHDTAVFYAEGDGGPQNYVVAIDWFRKAGAFGLADSQYNLGVLYEQGLGVTRDLAEAAYWYEIVGISGDPDGLARARELVRDHKALNLETIRARARNFVTTSSDAIANGQFGPPAWGIAPPRTERQTGLVANADTGTQSPGVEVPLSALDIAEIQVLLTRLGYSPGPADGIVGSGTRRAIMAFEYRNKITPTGQANAKLRAMLRERVFGIIG